MRTHERSLGSTNGLLRFTWLTIAAVYIVNMSGFVDTFTGSVVGCGASWPLCHGTLKPWTWDVHAWIEFGHRFLVLLMILMVVLLSVAAWRRFGANRRIRLWIGLALLGIVLESFFGALSVFSFNPPALMAAHLGIALLTFGGLIALAITLREGGHSERAGRERPVIPAKSRKLSIGLLVYLYADIYVGAYVSSSGAGTSFRGALLPTESWLDAGVAWLIDIAHRSLALVLLLLSLRLLVLAYRGRRQRPDFYRGSAAAAGLVVMQAVSGILLVATHLSLGSIMLHVGNVSLLYGVLVWLSVQSLHSRHAAILTSSKKPDEPVRPSSGSSPAAARKAAIS